MIANIVFVGVTIAAAAAMPIACYKICNMAGFAEREPGLYRFFACLTVMFTVCGAQIVQQAAREMFDKTYINNPVRIRLMMSE